MKSFAAEFIKLRTIIKSEDYGTCVKKYITFWVHIYKLEHQIWLNRCKIPIPSRVKLAMSSFYSRKVLGYNL